MADLQRAIAHLRKDESLRLSEVAFWLIVFGAWFLPDANYVLMTQILIWGLFAMSLDILVGFRNIPSLGHAAFFGTGAYVAGLMGKHGLSDPTLGLLCAAVISGILGLLVGIVARRLNGFTVLMLTLIFNLLLEEIVQKARSITGGDDGLQGVTISPILGLFRFDLFGKTGYLYAAVTALVVTLIVRRILSSPWGLRLRAARTNTRRLAAIGVGVERDTVMAFALAATCAGIAGALMAQTAQFVSLDALAFHRSADALIIVIIGGAGTLYGGFVGAAIYLLLRDSFSSGNPVYWYFWIGIMLVLVVSFFKKGIVPTMHELTSRWLPWGRGGRRD